MLQLQAVLIHYWDVVFELCATAAAEVPDGCWEQINAVMKNLNEDFVKLECEGFKFAAATTMVQQPNDVGRMGLRT